MSKTLIRRAVVRRLFFVTALGFFAKLYSGPMRGWPNSYGAGVLYEIFWVLVFFYIFPQKNSVAAIPVAVFVVTGILEITQLWQPPILERVRFTFLGSALIGATFSWWDFPHYALGCIIGWLWLRYMWKRSVSG